MKILKHIIIAFLALGITFLIISALPYLHLEKYNLQAESIKSYIAGNHLYQPDLNHDGQHETIHHYAKNTAFQSIDIIKNNALIDVLTFDKNEKFISQAIHFADLNRNNIAEWVFITANENQALLNIVEFDLEKSIFTRIEKVAVDSINFYNNEWDVINFDIIMDGNDVFFDLQAGYSVQPRNIYRYTDNTGRLTSSKKSSIVNTSLELLKYNGKRFLLAAKVSASGNTISPADSLHMSRSTNPDTLLLLDAKKKRVYRYGDFASYILLYTDQLDFAFEPISFYGWTNNTSTGLVRRNGAPLIVALTTSKTSLATIQNITLCNLQGEIVAQIPAKQDYQKIFTDGNMIVLKSQNALHLLNNQLVEMKTVNNITVASGFADIDKDGLNEFVAARQNSLLVFTHDFSHQTEYKLNYEPSSYFHPLDIITYVKDGKTYFQFHSNLFTYVFSYTKNRLAFFKYLIYFSLFAALYALIWLLAQLNIRRLEKEKLHLEAIVADRTKELQSKNVELMEQKEEITAQAELLNQQNEHLEKLGSFKESLTQTLIHDLKNPLNVIVNFSDTKNPGIFQNVEKALKTIHQSGKQLINLVVNILDVEKHEHTLMKINAVDCNIFELSSNAVSDIGYMADEKNISILNKIEPDVTVLVDKEIIERIFVNLLTNAIKYTPVNGMIVLMGFKNLSGFVHVEVSDPGQGIPADKIHLVFEKFGQISEKKSGKIRSTGLGLTFCKMAIEAHGGEIGVDSETGRGTTFWFTVPASETKIIHKPSEEVKPSQQTIKAAIPQEMKARIREIPMYQVTDICEILDTFESNDEHIENWKKQLKNAIFTANKELYNKLING